MLSDRERMVLHFCCTITIAKLTGIPHRDVIVEDMVEDIRKNRCRSLTDGQIADLLEEINQEMIGGRNMFTHLIDERHPDLTDEMKWAMTGERPKKNTDWRNQFR